VSVIIARDFVLSIRCFLHLVSWHDDNVHVVAPIHCAETLASRRSAKFALLDRLPAIAWTCSDGAIQSS
jgi:hypothetical protein